MTRKLLVILCTFFSLHNQAQAQDSKHWVASWGTAPMLLVETPQAWVRPPPPEAMPKNPLPSPIPPVPKELHDQSIRMIVRSSVAGDKVRLQFSNAQGAQPALLAGVHVARHNGNGAIDAATDHALTFGGKSSVTLHPGGLVVSDPLDMAVPALAELAVTVYVPDTTVTTTRHELGLNTTRIAKGNGLSAPTLTATETNRSYFWLAGLEVLAPLPAAVVIAFGDSITDGFMTSVDTHRDWPSLLAARLQQDKATAALGVINMGISGNRVLRTGAGASALTRFDRDVLARAGVRWMLLLEGINDINFTALPGVPDDQKTTAAEIIEGLSQLVDRAHANGIRVVGATLTPMGGLWLFNPATEAMRQAVNVWIRTSGKYDAIVDFDAATRDPQQNTRLKPEFDSGDHIHPNDAGNAAMAAVIDLGVFKR